MLAVAATVLPGCGSSGGRDPAPAAVGIPAYPFSATDAIVVDPTAIADAGGRYCRDTHGQGTAVEFFLGSLPLTGIDAICGGSAESPSAESILGELYLSGYFGGLWLRDSLLPGARAATREAVVGTSGIPDTVFQSLAQFATSHLDLARSGGDDAVLQSAQGSIPGLLSLYGYNLGYLQVAEENPPSGLPPVPAPIACSSFLDCRGTSVDLSILDDYRPALASLATPPDAAWQAIAEQVIRYGQGSVDGGRGVWEGILGGSSISASAYAPLLDLSAGYLLVSEAAVLASATATGNRDVGAARCGTLVETGLLIWSGSYFEGLASSAAPGTFPTLGCP